MEWIIWMLKLGLNRNIILNLELSPIWTNNYSNTKEQPIFKANFIYHQKVSNIIMVWELKILPHHNLLYPPSYIWKEFQ